MTTLTERYSGAVDFARLAHHGGVRKGTSIPYLSHVLAVSALVLEYGGDEDQAIVALLHDVAEDAGGEKRLDEISVKFGAGVGRIVRACSDSLAEDRAHKDPWWVRKVRYLAHLEAADEQVLLVSAADKVHNVEATVADYGAEGEELWSRFNADSGRGGQLWYQREVARVLCSGLTDGPARLLAARLATAVEALHDLVKESVGAETVVQDRQWAEKHAASHRLR